MLKRNGTPNNDVMHNVCLKTNSHNAGEYGKNPYIQYINFPKQEDGQIICQKHILSTSEEEGEAIQVLQVAKSRTNSNIHPPELVPPKIHQFLVRTFSSPTKCNHCTSLMVGLTRQGVVCELCGFACHTICCQKVPITCPVPTDQTKRPLGIDPTRGIGTAYEGYVKVPKMGAVKRGWVRQFVVVCDFKLFLYDISTDRNALPSVNVAQVLDMRDPEFAVTSVWESDVIHASKKDVPCIFRIKTSLIEGGPSANTLMLADNESEKKKWVVALSELHRILKRNNLPNTAIFKVHEIIDSSLSMIRGALCAAIIHSDQLLIGSEDGLFCINLVQYEISRIGETKKINQLWYVKDEHILLILCGKQRHVKLLPIRALENSDVEWIKVNDTKNCIAVCTGVIRRAPAITHAFVIALKRPTNHTQIIVYEINRNRLRHQKICEFSVAYNVQCVQIISDMRLVLGHQSGFTAYFLHGDATAMSLIHPENQLSAFLNYSGVDAIIVIEINSQDDNFGEYLLVFQSLAIYVDLQGRKSRDREIMYPALPTHITYSDGHLLVFSETHLDIFNAQTAEWVQSIGLKRSQPLTSQGNVLLSYVNDAPSVIYLANIHTKELLYIDDSERGLHGGQKKRFLPKEINKTVKNSDRRSKMISGPTNFNHISHMGPGEGIQHQRLLDLPTTIETADQSNKKIPIKQPTSRTIKPLQSKIEDLLADATDFQAQRGTASPLMNLSNDEAEITEISSRNSLITEIGTACSSPSPPLEQQ